MSRRIYNPRRWVTLQLVCCQTHVTLSVCCARYDIRPQTSSAHTARFTSKKGTPRSGRGHEIMNTRSFAFVWTTLQYLLSLSPSSTSLAMMPLRFAANLEQHPLFHKWNKKTQRTTDAMKDQGGKRGQQKTRKRRTFPRPPKKEYPEAFSTPFVI